MSTEICLLLISQGCVKLKCLWVFLYVCGGEKKKEKERERELSTSFLLSIYLK